MKNLILCVVMLATCFAIPQPKAEAGGFFRAAAAIRQARINRAVAIEVQRQQVLARQAIVVPHQPFVQRIGVPLQSQAIVVPGRVFSRQPVVVQQLGVGGRCTGFFR